MLYSWKADVFIHSSSVSKQCLRSVNHEQFPMQMTQTNKHSKWLQILAEEDFAPKLLWRTQIKIHRREDQRTQSLSTAITNMYRGKIQKLVHCKWNQWREGTPTADSSKSVENIRQCLKFTVNIIFFDAAIFSKTYMICTVHVKNIFPVDSGQLISLYSMSNNGFYSKLYFTMSSL